VSYVNKRLTRARLALAIFTTTLEEIAIYCICRWVLPEFDIRLPVAAVVGIMVAWGIFSVSLFVLTSNVLRKQIPTGLPSMVGTRGRVTSALSPEGMVRIKGELWVAKSKAGPIKVGEEIEVVEEDGLNLVVLRASQAEAKR
jgi:membrane-bound serine protease (ClpP class)